MHVTIRRYESVDQNRESELTKKVNESLMPRLSKLPGFSGYYLVETKDGVMTSINLFDTSAHADESNRVSAEWIREEKLEAALPNPPMVTLGEVVAFKTNGVHA
jgi:hypothetical protein